MNEVLNETEDRGELSESIESIATPICAPEDEALKLLSHQYKFMQSVKRYTALVGGFGCGKSYAVCWKTWDLARINAGFDGMLISRSAGQLRKLCVEFEKLLKDLRQKYRKKGFDEYHLTFSTPKGEKTCVIYTGTTENGSYTRWAGGNMAFVVIDEIDTMQDPVAVWSFANDRVRVRAPLLQTACGSTPEGYGFLWDFFKNQPDKDPKKRDDRELIKGCTFDNPYLDKGYIRNQIQTRDPRTLKAYVYGEFINLEGVPVYFRYSDDNLTELTLDNPRFDKCPLHIGIDFNKNINGTSISVIQDNIVYVLDEIYGLTDTQAVIDEVEKRYPTRVKIWYPDVAGYEGVQTLKRRYGPAYVKHYSKSPLVSVRVTSVNMKIKNQNGSIGIYVNKTKCPRLHDSLSRQVKDASGAPDKKLGLDHIVDGFGYFIIQYWLVKDKDLAAQSVDWVH